ncbi:MAG TPA: pseudouridine synthase [Chloroflexia bacterium]
MKKDKWKSNPNDLPRWKRLTPAQPNASAATPATPTDRHDPSAGERLQKILAQAGIASRRAAEELIAAGRVTVNGEVVKEMGVRANPAVDTIAVDGKPLKSSAEGGQVQKFVYIALNKPLGVVSTVKDPEGRPTVLTLLAGARLAEQGLRVYPVGRLDTDSTGLLLLTNDGDLTFRLTHPRYAVDKEYRVVVRGRPSGDALAKLREGVMIEGGLTSPAKVDVLNHTEGNTTLRITIHEGRKRQVRLMTVAVGHPVIELTRVRFGPIELGDLPPGKWRNLAMHEAHALRKAVKLKPAPASQIAGISQSSAPTPAKAPTRPRPTSRPRPPEASQPEAPTRRRPPSGGGARQGSTPARRLLRGAQPDSTSASRGERGARGRSAGTGTGTGTGTVTGTALRTGTGTGRGAGTRPVRPESRPRTGPGPRVGGPRADTRTRTKAGTGAPPARQSPRQDNAGPSPRRAAGAAPRPTGGPRPPSPSPSRRTGSAPPRNNPTKRRGK